VSISESGGRSQLLISRAESGKR